MASAIGRSREWARLGARTRLSELRQEIADILAAYPEFRRESDSTVPTRGPRRQISAAARRAMSAGMRRFWARRKAKAAASTDKPQGQPKRRVSAEARAKMAAAQRARWAKVKKTA
jgi:hypothetical protein